MISCVADLNTYICQNRHWCLDVNLENGTEKEQNRFYIIPFLHYTLSTLYHFYIIPFLHYAIIQFLHYTRLKLKADLTITKERYYS